MEHKDAKLRRLTTKLGARQLHILFELLDGILQRSARIINLVDNQDALANQAAHLAERAQIQPLRARNLGAGLLDVGVGAGRELLVQRQPDGLDGDVGVAGALEEGPQDARGDVSAAADGDHQLRVDLLEELGRCLLTELVHLGMGLTHTVCWGEGRGRLG